MKNVATKPDRSPGFVLLLTFFVITLAAGLATYLVARVITQYKWAAISVTQEQAKGLALSGINLVKSELDHKLTDKGRKRATHVLLSLINRWEHIVFDEKIDGIKGELWIYITCEDGKLDLNQFFDPAKKKFIFEKKPEITKFFALLNEKSKSIGAKSVELGNAIKQALADRNKLLYDITELFEHKAFEPLRAPLLPPYPQSEDDEPPFTLSDLFTVERRAGKIKPYYLSTAVCSLLGLEQLPDDREETATNLAQKEKQSMNWSTDWDTLLAKPYGKKFAQLDSFISTQFDSAGGADLISVLCYGKVRERIQGVLAFLKSTKTNDNYVRYVIKKVYWI